MKRTFIAVLVCVASILGLSFDATGAPLAVSTFNTGDEGWSVTGDVHGFQWQSNIGNPPGSILGIDDATGSTWGFVAPAKFLGDKESAYSGTLSYDIKISDSDGLYPWKYQDVGLTGGGISIYWYESSSPDVGVWTSRNISLDPAEWWKSDNTNPTVAEMKQVLGGLTELYIRAEYKTGDDYAYLDNVVLTPEPATICLLGLGVLSLLRKKK